MNSVLKEKYDKTVKTEFGRFGEILDKTQKKLAEASNTIEQAATRSRA